MGLGDNKQIAQAARAIRRGLENQVRGLGFSLIEVLSPCPTIWKIDAGGGAALGARCDGEDLSAGRLLRPHQRKAPQALGGQPQAPEGMAAPQPDAPPLDKLPRILGVAEEDLPEGNAAALAQDEEIDLEVRIAGFGGQGVLLLGEVLAEAGLDAGLEVSWLPSYGPEMRSGTSNCHVRLSRQTVDSPLVTAPNVLVAMNEPSLRKFDKSVRAGGWIIYNGDEFPADCARGRRACACRSIHATCR